jgi:hypothetical protein
MTDDASSSRRWTLAIMALGLGVFGLAFWGFRVRHAADAQPPATLDILYWCFQLFGLEWNDGGGPMPAALQLARFAAPLVTGALVLEAVRMVTSNVSRAVGAARLWRLRDHLIICGLGRKAVALALASRRRDPGIPVVIIERDPAEARAAACRRAGVLVTRGDASDPEALLGAGLLRARALVALTGDDGVNIQIAERARAVFHGGQRPPLRVVVHVVDDELARLIQELELSSGRGRDGVELAPFDIYEAGARALLEAPPQPPPAEPGDHLVIVGVGAFGSAVAVQAAALRSARKPQRRPLRITLLDHDPTRRSALLARHPELAAAWELRQVEMDVTAGEFHTAAFLQWDGVKADAAYVCFDDDARAVATALSLQPRAHPQAIPVVVRRSEETGLANLLDPARGLYDFPLVDRACTPALIDQTLSERIARALHEHRDRAVPWEEIGEERRRDARERARALLPAIQAAGYRVVPFRAATDAVMILQGENLAVTVKEAPAVLRSIGFAVERR